MSGPAPSQILVVDDEPSLRRGVCRLVEQAGHRVLEAGSLAEARQRLELGGVDVLVLDVTLPDGNGLALLDKTAGSTDTTVPTVVFTSSQNRADLQLALERGAVSFLSKSADGLTLTAQIEIALREGQGRRSAATQRRSLEGALADALSHWRGLPRGLAQGLCSAWDLRHIETGAHVRRIGAYSEVLASALGSTDAEAAALGEVAVLHDIGKIAIPDAILCKPAKLTPAEFELMKRHTVEGAKILSAVPHPFFERAAVVALRHHERWDGSGYPGGLRGEQCPLEARVVAVADVYDALGQTRCYKPAWTEQQIRDFFEESSGNAFESKLVDALFDSIPRLRELASQLPDSGTFPLKP
jgi:response regulator RpfG family c-di-GMP phosphodiesterase